jgi:hypothetical protein
MAQIALTDIPNAPQVVADPTTANYRFPDANSTLDKAQSDIRQGFSGMMQDPARAGIMGDAITSLGADISKGGVGLAEGAMYAVKGMNERAFNEAHDTGFQKLYANQTAALQVYNQARLQAPPTQWPTLYQQAMGNDPNNPNPGAPPALTQGMSPLEQAATGMHTLNAYHQGMTQAGNEAFQWSQQQVADQAQLNIFNASGDPDTQMELVEAANNTGAISPAQYLFYKKTIPVQAAVNDLRKNIILNNGQGDPMLYMKKVYDEGGGMTYNGQNISNDEIGKMLKVGAAAKTDYFTGIMENMKNQISAQHISDPKLVKGLPGFDKLPKEQQDAMWGYVTNQYAGSPVGQANQSQGQIMVNTFPPKDTNLAAKTYLDTRTWITQNVPAPFADDLMKQLDKRREEMSANNGFLTPDSQNKKALDENIQMLLQTGTLGKYTNVTPNQKINPEVMTANQQALQNADSIRQEALKSLPPNPTIKDVNNAVNNATRQYRASHEAPQGIFSSMWHGLFGSNDAYQGSDQGNTDPLSGPTKYAANQQEAEQGDWKDATATSFGTNKDGTLDKADNQNGYYAGAKTGDSSYMGASLSRAALKEYGIDPDNREQVAKYQVEVRNGDNVVRVPIADQGPAKWVENRQGRTLDLTGAVHRELKTNEKDPVQYRVVPV